MNAETETEQHTNPRFTTSDSIGGNGDDSAPLLASVALASKKPAVFASQAMREICQIVKRVARSDAIKFLVGPTGCGKEVVADMLHKESDRRDKPFLKINCAALPRELVESELFGSKKGAFTGACDRPGIFREANGGTLLLDEVSEMPQDAQAKLLRVLQDREVRAVGDTVSYKVECRVMASTNRDLEEAVRIGKLRDDLRWRLSCVLINIPSLRERPEDIVPLANGFLEYFVAKDRRPIKGFTAGALKAIKQFSWPGNVRQLEQAIQQAVLLADEFVDIRHLGFPPTPVKEDGSLQELTLMEMNKRTAIVAVLNETRGNKLETARLLGIGRQTLYNNIKVLVIHEPDSANSRWH